MEATIRAINTKPFSLQERHRAEDIKRIEQNNLYRADMAKIIGRMSMSVRNSQGVMLNMATCDINGCMKVDAIDFPHPVYQVMFSNYDGRKFLGFNVVYVHITVRLSNISPKSNMIDIQLFDDLRLPMLLSWIVDRTSLSKIIDNPLLPSLK